MNDPGFLLAAIAFAVSVVFGARLVYAPRARLSPEYFAVLTSAMVSAKQRGQSLLTPEALLLAALYDRGIAAAFEASRLPVVLIRERLLASMPASKATALDGEVKLSRAVIGIVRRAHRRARRAARREVTLVDVLAGMMETKGGLVAALLAEAKLDIDAMERAPVRAEIPAEAKAESEYRSGVREPQVEVRVLNDDKSTMEGVMTVLKEVFAMGEDEARHVMLLTHRAGSAIVGSYSPADAHERVGRATQRARELEMPLRFTISS